jgi:hypothetical protein
MSERNLLKMKRNVIFYGLVILGLTLPLSGFTQGKGIPSEKWGLGFGNLTTFTGLRFNIIDENIKSIKGINITAWLPKDFENQSGSCYGLGVGITKALGTEKSY